MARKSSVSSLMKSIAREQARQQREREKAIRAHQREQVRLEKLAKQQYQEARAYDVDQMNLELDQTIQELGNVLEHTLFVDDTITFDSLRLAEGFDLYSPNKDDYKIPKLSKLEGLLPGAKDRHQEKLKAAKEKYEKDVEEFERAKSAFELKVKQRDAEVDEFQKDYFSGDPESIITYCNMVLERSEYPDGFPQEFKLAYVPEPKQLVIEYELPTKDIVPSVLSYSYLKTKDEIREKARIKTEIKELYKEIVSAVTLRTIHELFEADQGNALEIVVFNGFIQTIDPATGHDIRPHIISVQTTKEEFMKINLGRVEKSTCIRNLGATVSPRPEEAQAVKPIIDFNMVDRRFVDQSDVLSDLESRPNLMDLDPFEFENLVSNLFDQLGFDTKQTQTSRDGGVDAIAFDTRPIVGGKIVIQAKRYKNVVGVSATRDLYGTMINEGANKGILVTTSHYGKDAYEFVKDKPIELIDGGNLLYLLRDIGVEARIIFPED